jgi:hypothetical protein
MAHITHSFSINRHEAGARVRLPWGAFACAALAILIASRAGQAQQLDPSSAAAPSLSAQSGTQQAQLALKGCGAAGSSARTAITFVDQHHNLWYRATNKGLHLTDSRHVYVIGGLLPTWNLAAQAGATDPGPTFTAMQWTLPNQQIGASPYADPKVRVVWVPSLNSACRTP